MPISYEIDTGAGIVRVTASGQVTAAELHTYFRDSLTAAGYRPDLQRLMVVVDITSFPTSAEVQAISMEIRSRAAVSPSVRFAVVVNTPLGLGMANMFFIQAGLDERFATFPDEAAARAWLAG